jgi:hypothetical protein
MEWAVYDLDIVMQNSIGMKTWDDVAATSKTRDDVAATSKTEQEATKKYYQDCVVDYQVTMLPTEIWLICSVGSVTLMSAHLFVLLVSSEI